MTVRITLRLLEKIKRENQRVYKEKRLGNRKNYYYHYYLIDKVTGLTLVEGTPRKIYEYIVNNL